MSVCRKMPGMIAYIIFWLFDLCWPPRLFSLPTPLLALSLFPFNLPVSLLYTSFSLFLTLSSMSSSAPSSTIHQNVVPSEVGWQFVPQYYTFVNKQPNRLHCFYTKSSTFVHGNEGEESKPCFGQHVSLFCLSFTSSSSTICRYMPSMPYFHGQMLPILSRFRFF